MRRRVGRGNESVERESNDERWDRGCHDVFVCSLDDGVCLIWLDTTKNERKGMRERKGSEVWGYGQCDRSGSISGDGRFLPLTLAATDPAVPRGRRLRKGRAKAEEPRTGAGVRTTPQSGTATERT